MTATLLDAEATASLEPPSGPSQTTTPASARTAQASERAPPSAAMVGRDTKTEIFDHFAELRALGENDPYWPIYSVPVAREH